MGQALRVIFENGVFRPLEPVDLTDHQELTITLPQNAATQTTAQTKDAPSIWDEIDNIMSSIPDEELKALPNDGAEHHDYYLYNAPKGP